jgi:hypothetical protein
MQTTGGVKERTKRAPRKHTHLRVLNTVVREDPGGVCLWQGCKRTDGLQVSWCGTTAYTIVCPDHVLWDPEASY